MKKILSVLIAAVMLLAMAVPAMAEGDDDLILTNCDTTDLWTANSQGENTLTGDTENFTEGAGSVGATATNGKLNEIVYLPEAPMDISGYNYLEFDVYFSDLTWFEDCGGVMMELTSSGKCDVESDRFMKGALRPNFENGAIEGKEGWYHFVLDLNAPQGQANGGLNKANFNYFRFYSVDQISTTPDYTVRFDNMRFTNTPKTNEPAPEPGEVNLVMSSCDTTDLWSANSQGEDALTGDTENFTEGTGSVGATAINGKLNQIVFMPESPMDVSAYKYVEFDIYFSDLTWFEDCGGVMIELTSSGKCDFESNRYMKGAMRPLFETGALEGKEGWYHFVLELDNPQGKANGELNKANFNYFRFYSVDPISTTPDYTMRIDNIQFTNNPVNYHPAGEEEPPVEPGPADEPPVEPGETEEPPVEPGETEEPPVEPGETEQPPVEPDTTPDTKPTQEPESGSSVGLIIGIIVAVAAVAAVVIVVLRKRSGKKDGGSTEKK